MITRREVLKTGLVAGVGLALLPGRVAAASDVVTLDLPTDGTDVSDLVRQAIKALPDGSTILIPPGDYRSEIKIGVWRKHGLTIYGSGARFYRTENQDTKERHWKFQECSGIIVDGFIIEGTHTERNEFGYPTYLHVREFEHGFEMLACDDMTVRNVTIRNVWGDGVYVGSINLGKGVHVGCNRINVENVQIDGSGRQGVGVALCDDLTISRSTVFAARSGIDLEPPSQDKTINRVLVSHCRIDCGNLPVNNGTGGPANDVILDSNLWKSGWFRVGSPGRTRRRNWVFRNNGILGGEFVNNAVNAAFWFQDTDGIVMEHNYHRLRESRNKDGAYFSDCTDVTLVDNTFDGARSVWAYNTGQPVPAVVHDNRTSLDGEFQDGLEREYDG